MSDHGFIVQKQAERNRIKAEKNETIVSKRQIAATGVASLLPGSQILTACNPSDTDYVLSFGTKVDQIGSWEGVNRHVYGRDDSDHLTIELFGRRLTVTTRTKVDGDGCFLIRVFKCWDNKCIFLKTIQPPRISFGRLMAHTFFDAKTGRHHYVHNDNLFNQIYF